MTSAGGTGDENEMNIITLQTAGWASRHGAEPPGLQHRDSQVERASGRVALNKVSLKYVEVAASSFPK